MTTEPMRRMATASCANRNCKTAGYCRGARGEWLDDCLARAARCFDALLPLSEEQVASWKRAGDQIVDAHPEATDTDVCRATTAAIIKAAKGE